MRQMLTALAVLVVAASAVHAQNYNAAASAGLTVIDSQLAGNTYTWKVSNISHQTNPAWDVLVWSLVPYNVRESISVTSPAGWSWNGGAWEQWNVSSPQKYYTPPAIGPGQELTFTYTFDPLGAFINPAAGEGLVFLTHVGAVVPGSGDAAGNEKWGEYSGALAGQQSWYDASTIVPEPASVAALSVGLVSLLGLARRKKS